MRTTLSLTFNINPVPASRPRVTRWGTFYGKKYKEFKKEMSKLLVESEQKRLSSPTLWLEGLISADMTFFVPMAKSWSKKKKSLKNGEFCDNNADLDAVSGVETIIVKDSLTAGDDLTLIVNNNITTATETLVTYDASELDGSSTTAADERFTLTGDASQVPLHVTGGGGADIAVNDQ